MGSRAGYEYGHRFSMVDEAEINSMYKSTSYDGAKTFVFEFRTNFILKTRPEEKRDANATIDSERYDACVPENTDGYNLFWTAGYRLKEYWITDNEILLLANEAFAFAKRMADDPQHAALNLIPVVVDLDVCTMQQEGESFDACMDRAITTQKLVPLYLWQSEQTVEGKPLPIWTWSFLCNLDRIRVEDIDEGLAFMPVCPICSRNTCIGAQISLLPCQHAFHSHCIVRLLENNNLCPLCHYPAYEDFRLR